jgi:hypothetical protein
MNPRLAPIADIFRTNTRIYHMALADLEDAQTRTLPAGNGNCMLWIAGHAAASRAGVAKMIGVAPDFSLGEGLGRGEKRAPADLPPLAEVTAFWDEVSGRILARMEELTDEELNVETDASFPVQDRTVLGALAFLALHDSYHMGQLGYLRTVLGKPGLAG